LFKNIVLSCLVFFVFALSSWAIDKREARVEKIADYPTEELRVRPFLSTADTCYVVHSDTIVWQIDSWVVGAELYKSYLDPDLCCENAYPYTIVEVNMPMSFAASTDIYVSVDIEGVDSSDPSCPVPGELLSISSEYGLTVPEAGVYNIWIPLDTPCVVNGPFFAGFYIANTLDVYSGAAVITDDDPALCVSYNIWDTEIGYIDLCNNDYYSFPGRLILYVSGIPGGGGNTTQPEPVVELVSHNFNDTLFSNAEIWANETAGSDIIDYVSFEYSTGGNYYKTA